MLRGGGSNIIKENEININDIGSNSGSGDSSDDDISYFGISLGDSSSSETYKILMILFPLKKGVHYANIQANVSINTGSTFDSSCFYEFGGNINDKSIYENKIWYSIKEYLSDIYNTPIEVFKPISKEDFYRTNYTKEEAAKIEEEYYNYFSQNAPSKP